MNAARRAGTARRASARSDRSLGGVRAVVTGGGSGIGLAIARRLRAGGANVALIGRDAARLERALADLGRGDGDHAIVCDVGDADAVARAFRSLGERGWSPQVLVNNAGVAPTADLLDTSTALWDETLRINLGGVFHCTRAALPALLEAPFGRVVNIASTAGLRGYPRISAYCASKHGVVGLTRALALELAKTRVTVNAVCPGYTETDMAVEAIRRIAAATNRPLSDARDVIVRRNPQRRLVLPDEVADTVAWLCLPQSQAITGQAISVSGGEVMAG